MTTQIFSHTLPLTHTHTHTHTLKLVKSWYSTVLTQNATVLSKLIVWLSYIKHVNIKMSYRAYNFTMKRITRTLNIC